MFNSGCASSKLVQNQLKAPVFSNISLRFAIIAYTYTQLTIMYKYKNVTFINILLIYSRYEQDKPLLMGGYLFCLPPVNREI